MIQAKEPFTYLGLNIKKVNILRLRLYDINRIKTAKQLCRDSILLSVPFASDAVCLSLFKS